MEQELKTYKIAAWYQRILGFLIDYALSIGIAAIYMDANRSDFWSLNPQEKRELTQGFGFLIYLLYCLVSESLFNKTIGKLITCTVVRKKATLTKVNFFQILGRTLCRLIPFEFLSFTRRKPIGWHDSISGTVVINSSYNYAVFYERIKVINKGYLRIHWILSIIAGVFTFGLGFIAYWLLSIQSKLSIRFSSN